MNDVKIIAVPRRSTPASTIALLAALGHRVELLDLGEQPMTPRIRPVTPADQARMASAEEKRERRRLRRQRIGGGR